MGTSARFRLSPGTYTYYLYVVVRDVVLNPDMPLTDAYGNWSPAVSLASSTHLGGTVTLP